MATSEQLDEIIANVSRDIDRLADQRDRYRAALEAVLEEAEDREDVEDASDGRPRANAWMGIATICREALGK